MNIKTQLKAIATKELEKSIEKDIQASSGSLAETLRRYNEIQAPNGNVSYSDSKCFGNRTDR